MVLKYEHGVRFVFFSLLTLCMITVLLGIKIILDLTHIDRQITSNTIVQSSEPPPYPYPWESWPAAKKAGQLILTTLDGTTLTAYEKNKLESGEVGGYVLLGKNIRDAEQLKTLTGEITATATVSGIRPWVSVDQEGGGVSRIPWIDTTAQEDITTVEQAYDVAATRGAQLKELGIMMNLAPVLETGDDPEAYAVSQHRVFKGDAGALGLAMIKGYEQTGIVAVAKHYPGGLARSTSDPHTSLPVVESTADELVSDLIPYQILIQSGCQAIMATHLQYPVFSEEITSSSKLFLQDILRTHLNFQGVIVVDDLAMRAITNKYDIGDYAIKSLNAGGDVLIVSGVGNYETVHKRLMEAINDGSLPEDKVNASLDRIMKLRE